jgi:transmembrane sensor
MSPSETDSRHERMRDEAHGWVAKILDDPDTHAAGLRAWVGDDEERANAYNTIFRNADKGGLRGGQLYGNVRERQASRYVPKVQRIPFTRVIGLTFALLFVGTVLSFAVSILSGHISSFGTPSERPIMFATHIGEIRTVSLPDGSRMTLDTQTSIRVTFSNGERRVDLLAGRARFEVVHNDHQPFRLYAGGMTVTDKGTVFDVDTSHGLEVHLFKGAADVTPPAGQDLSSRETVSLRPGQSIRFERMSSPQVAAAPAQLHWPEGKQTFDDVPATAVAAEANRYSKTKILIADPAAAGQNVFLDIDVRDPHLVAEQIARPLGLQLDESQPGQIILRRP